MEQQDKELFRSPATHLSQQCKDKKCKTQFFWKQIVHNHQVKIFKILSQYYLGKNKKNLFLLLS